MTASLLAGESRVEIALGANLGNPLTTLEQAVEAVANLAGCRLISRSGWWRSAPLGPAGQPDYINGAATIATTLGPLALLDALQQIERAHGRVRSARWGARTLDLDLLLWGERLVNHPRLQIPHPEISGRRFVLQPLAELDPSREIPGQGRVDTLLDHCAHWPMERLDEHGNGHSSLRDHTHSLTA